MSVLRQLHNKSPYPQSVCRVLATRFFVTAQKPCPDEPTSAHYDELVNKAGQNGDLETVGYLLNNRIGDGCFNTLQTFKFLANNECFRSLLHPLIQTICRIDKENHRKNAFDLLIARLCKLEKIDESLEVIDTMIKGGHGLNAVSFHPILNALTRKRKMEEAWRLMDRMRNAGVSPDLISYNTLLMTYCLEGKLTEASAVVEKIEEEGMATDGRTFDCLILGASKAGKFEGALALLRGMVDAGIHVHYSTPSHVIKEMLRRGYYDQAVRFVMTLRGMNDGLDQENFAFLATKLVNLGRNNEAMVVLEEMSKMRLKMGQKLSHFYRGE